MSQPPPFFKKHLGLGHLPKPETAHPVYLSAIHQIAHVFIFPSFLKHLPSIHPRSLCIIACTFSETRILSLPSRRLKPAFSRSPQLPQAHPATYSPKLTRLTWRRSPLTPRSPKPPRHPAESLTYTPQLVNIHLCYTHKSPSTHTQVPT